ncbi:MAG TPA: hypothetical protein VMV94_18130 [Phycisphaerae bacterium]|nr:hypothetical protein [Phycisphaerae bacterium]
MFIFSQGIHPIIGVLVFVGMIVLVMYSFTRVWRSGPPDVDEYWPGRRNREADSAGGTADAGEDPSPGEPLQAGRWECRHPNCRAINPPHGRYCRMCGRPR